MNGQSNERRSSLSVSNFGPIVEGEVELRPFTVFVGPSNTGKSYLAVLVYAMHRFFLGNYLSLAPFSEGSRSASVVRKIIRDWLIDEGGMRFLSTWLTGADSRLGDSDKHILLPKEIMLVIRHLLSNTLIARGPSDEILTSLGASSFEDLTRQNSGGEMSIRLEIPNTLEDAPDGATKFKLLSLSGQTIMETNVLESIPDFVSPSAGLPLAEIMLDLESRSDSHRFSSSAFLISRLTDMLADEILSEWSDGAYYLPADRTGIMHAHRIAVASLIRSAKYTGLRPEGSLPQLSGVIGDFLSELLTMPAQMQQNPDMTPMLAASVEVGMLDGEIEVDENVSGYPEFRYHPRGWRKRLPLMNASSMVSELAPVVLYLRHVVQPGDLLIIEEPESHLHPSMQVEFVRQLAVVVKAGVRILITTHSEWVLEELANLVRLSELPEEHREGLDGVDSALSVEDVGVWLFEPTKRPKGSVVREVPFSADAGGYVSDYEDVAIGTHNSWASIGNRLEELKRE